MYRVYEGYIRDPLFKGLLGDHVAGLRDPNKSEQKRLEDAFFLEGCLGSESGVFGGSWVPITPVRSPLRTYLED